MIHPRRNREVLRPVEPPRERGDLAQRKKLSKEELISLLRQTAHRHGLFLRNVSHLVGNRRWGDRKTLVNINGYRCRLLQPTSTKFTRGSSIPHARPGIHRTPLEESDFVVVYQEAASLPPNLFIIPSGVLLHQFHRGEAVHRFYIPHAVPQGNLWFPYLNAWHLLAKHSSETSAAG